MTRIIAVLALIACAAQVVQAEETSHIRMLLHGTNVPDSSSTGIAGWVIAPNITSVPDKWLTIVGPRIQKKTWWLEAMTGVIINQGVRTELIDIRAKLPDIMDITPWLNVQWVNFSKGFNGEGYTYLELDRPIAKGLLAIGVETENTHKPDEKDDLSLGVHTNIMLGNLKIIFVRQWHDGSKQHWIRSVLNF